MKELDRIIESFRQYRENKAAERKRFSSKNLFKLMESMTPPRTYEPFSYVVQDPKYFVEVFSIDYFGDPRPQAPNSCPNHWVMERQLKIHQPIGDEMEAVTLFSFRKTDEEYSPEEIVICSTIYLPPEQIGALEYKRISSIKTAFINRLSKSGLKHLQINDDGLHISNKEHEQIIESAFKIAQPVVTKRLLPTSIEKPTINFASGVFQPQLI